MSQGPGRLPEMGRYAAFAQVGFEMVMPVGLGVWLDYRFGTLPWLTAVGAFLGFAGGLTHILILLKRFENDRPHQGGK